MNSIYSQQTGRIEPKGINHKIESFLRRFAYSEHSMIGSEVRDEVWYSSEGKGAVPYTSRAGIWIVAGDTLAADCDIAEVTREFVAHARRHGKVVAFLPATERFAKQMCGGGVRIVRIAAAPYFDLTIWNPRGNVAKHLRSSINRARRSGLTVAPVDDLSSEFRSEAAGLLSAWSGSRRAGIAFGWLFAMRPFHDADTKRYVSARTPDGKLVGLLVASPIPTREGWYLEDVLRADDAPRGTADLLVYETFRTLALEGAKLATLGSVPLCEERGGPPISLGNNRLLEGLLRITPRVLRRIYNFTGLQQFKSKFVPSWWENEYAVVSSGRFLSPRVANAVLGVAIPGGILHLIFLLTTSAITDL